MNICIYLFSYNRGIYLKNLINSIEDCFKNPDITVIDDGSDNEETIQILKEIQTEYRVITFTESRSPEYGGLYHNMQFAMQEAKERGFEYVLLLPEDCQIVRDVTEKDLSRIEKFFEDVPNSVQCISVFREKAYSITNIRSHISPLRSCNYWIKTSPKNIFSKGLSFMDFGVYNIERFFSILQNFEDKEQDTELKAFELGLVVGYDIYPWIGALPFMDYIRNNTNPSLLELIKKISNAGFYPITKMDKNKVDVLFNRNIGHLIVYGEDWLDVPNVPEAEFWSFWGGLFHLEAYNDSRRKLAKELVEIQNKNFNKKIQDELMIECCEKYLNDT